MINGFRAMSGFLAVFGYADSVLAGGYGIDTTVQRLITSPMSIGIRVSTLSAGPIMSALLRGRLLTRLILEGIFWVPL